MSTEKKVLVLTIIMAVLFVGGIVVMGCTNLAIVAPFYCGISAFMGLIYWLQLREGEKPNLILFGAAMVFFGVIFSAIVSANLTANILASVIYAAVGFVVMVKGLKDWLVRRRTKPKTKVPLNKNIYIGIGLVVGGYAATLTLFMITPLLMIAGVVMLLSGLVILGIGIDQRKKVTKPVSNPVRHIPNNTKQVPLKRCAGCGTFLRAAMGIYVIDGETYCRECKTTIDRNVENQHAVCSVCGVDLPAENMHIIDQDRLCHDCFLKRFDAVDFYNEEAFSIDAKDRII